MAVYPKQTARPCSSDVAISEAQAAAIRAVFEQRGELSAVAELRRLFPGVTDNRQAPRVRARDRRLEAAQAVAARPAACARKLPPHLGILAGTVGILWISRYRSIHMFKEQAGAAFL